MFNQFIKHIEKEFHITLTEMQSNQFRLYFQTLIAYNQKVNLTRITEENEVYYKHFYDSLTMIDTIDLKQVQTICDMGAGAGFPSIPLKIIYPHLKITIIDSLGKRIKFLEFLLETLEIKDVKLIYDRIENYAVKNLNTFDIVTARALGALPLILELGIPMVKEGKNFIAYKGSNYEEEIKESKRALDILKSHVSDVKTYELPYGMGYRAHVVIKKDKHIQGYPRNYSVIKKKPL